MARGLQALEALRGGEGELKRGGVTGGTAIYKCRIACWAGVACRGWGGGRGGVDVGCMCLRELGA